MIRIVNTLVGIALLITSNGSLADSKMPMSPAPEGASAYIVSPKNGASVKSPVTVVFGLKGMGVAPAGVNSKHTGHHHLIIDAKIPETGKPIPANDNYKHFGKGQTEASLKLKPGKHTLQLILGDHNHVPHRPMVKSDVITITVK